MSPRELRTQLVGRLYLRTSEIQAAIYSRILDLPGSPKSGDPTYAVGLEAAGASALRYALEDIEAGGHANVPIPSETAKQARRAAREGVGLDTVMRRYAAGNKVLEEFILAESDGMPSKLVCEILSEQGPRVDRLMEFVAAEYRDELHSVGRSAVQQHADQIVQLLENGSPMPPSEVGYDFDRWHVGAIFIGQSAATMARRFGAESPFQTLYVPRDDETAWAWLGSSERLEAANVGDWLAANMSMAVSAAVGELRQGLAGWRQTHYEARLALPAMLCQPRRVTRCRDVILDSAAIRDPWLARSLVETYVAPLDGSGISGADLRKTLQAYFQADQTAVNAAIVLGIERRTVERRLRRVESILGQPIKTCAVQLQVALRVEELLALSSESQPQQSGA